MMLARTFFGIAATAGVVHGAFSIYWGFGGTALLNTIGAIADKFDVKWLVIVGVVKIVAAVLPMLLLRTGRFRRPLRLTSWCGSILLVLWGGMNTVTASLLLLGVVPRPESFDRMGTIGHALLWDPLFLIWGASLFGGLAMTAPRRERPPAAG